jgi:hypothetical protein
MLSLSLVKAQLVNGQGLEGVIVEKYYLSNAADSINAANNGAVSPLRVGSITYRVYIDMAPGWKFINLFGSSDPQGNLLHPFIIKTTTDFYNDPLYGQVYPQGTSTVNVRKNTAMIDSWLSVGGVAFNRMGVPKTEDPNGSIGNANNVLLNNPGGAYGMPINSVVATPTVARDGMMPGVPKTPTYLGPVGATDIFDQSPASTFSVADGAVAALGGAAGTTTSNVILIGQFTTKGVFSFSLNVQVKDTLTGASEIYVPTDAYGSEYNFPALGYTSPTETTTPQPPPVDTTDVGIHSLTHGYSSLSIYPNPSKGMFTISAFDVKESNNNFYDVYDITGRIVFSKKMGKVSSTISETVDISDLVDGLYFLNVSLDGVISSRKILKE